LRVKDLDFGRGEITMRDGKGQKDRLTMLAAALREPLRDHLRQERELHDADLQRGLRRAPLPFGATSLLPSEPGKAGTGGGPGGGESAPGAGQEGALLS